MKITISKLKCERCGHEWVPRTETVRTCAACKSPYWDTPKDGRRGQVGKSAGKKKISESAA